MRTIWMQGVRKGGLDLSSCIGTDAPMCARHLVQLAHDHGRGIGCAYAPIRAGRALSDAWLVKQIHIVCSAKSSRGFAVRAPTQKQTIGFMRETESQLYMHVTHKTITGRCDLSPP